MEKMIKMYILNKVVEFTKKNIYRTEIINKGKAGVVKFNAVIENFWDNAEKYVVNEKNKDRKWIPDIFENIAEDVIHEVIKVLKDELTVEKLVQGLFNEEKVENPGIF